MRRLAVAAVPAVVLAAAGCHSRSPGAPDAARPLDAASSEARPPQGHALTPQARLDELCAAAGARPVSTTPPPTAASSVPPETSAQLTRAMRGLLTAREAPAEQTVGEAYRVRAGYLASISVPGAANARGASDRWGFIPDRGPVRRVDDTLLGMGDLDGDGVAEPVLERCSPRPMFGKECRLTVWFPADDVMWSGRLLGGTAIVARMLDGRRRIALVPSGGSPGDVLAPDDVTLLTFDPSGVIVSDGAKLHAAEAPAGALRTRLAPCGHPVGWRADRWRQGLLALGATPDEAPAIATALALAHEAADHPDVRVELATRDRPSAAAQAVWDALPRPTSRCHALSAEERAARTAERKAAITARAALRFAEVSRPVEVDFGCTSKNETPMLVTWAETTTLDHVWNAELYDLHGDQARLLASTRARWGAEWNIVQMLALGPAADLDGDGEDETTVLGTAYEVGATHASRIAAVVRGDALVQAAGTFFGPAFVAALGPRTMLVLPTPPEDPEHGPLPWPPPAFVLDGGKLVRSTPAWPAAVTARRAAHDAAHR